MTGAQGEASGRTKTFVRAGTGIWDLYKPIYFVWLWWFDFGFKPILGFLMLTLKLLRTNCLDTSTKVWSKIPKALCCRWLKVTHKFELNLKF